MSSARLVNGNSLNLLSVREFIILYRFPFFIGQCCVDQIIAPPEGGSGSGLNEIVPFTNLLTLTLAWNATRKARFGDAGVFLVEILGEDGVYRPAGVESVPNSIINTTSYAFDFGGLASGRIIIT